MRNLKERLRDILDAVARIERYAACGQEALEQDEPIQVGLLHHIQVIGEAAANLGRDVYEAHPEAPWPQIAATRNVLGHQYFGGDICRKYSTISS